MKPKDDARPEVAIQQLAITKFFQLVEERAWTDAEKELDVIRQKAQNSPWSRGYVKALEGLLLTNKSNDDKYLFLPKALSNKTDQTLRSLGSEFSEFASNELHGEYDRGYFKALEEYLQLIRTLKTSTMPQGTLDENPRQVPTQDGKAQYSEE